MGENAGMFAGMGLFILVYFVVMIGVVVILLMSLWRGMRAQERMEAHLADIAAALGRRAL